MLGWRHLKLCWHNSPTAKLQIFANRNRFMLVTFCFWKKCSIFVLEGEQEKQGMYSPGTAILPVLWSFAKLWFQQCACPDPHFKLQSSKKDCKNYTDVGSALPPLNLLHLGRWLTFLWGGGLATGAWFQFSFCFVQLPILPIPIIFLYTLVVSQFNKTKPGAWYHAPNTTSRPWLVPACPARKGHWTLILSRSCWQGLRRGISA